MRPLQNPFIGLAPAELAMAETAMKQIMMMGAAGSGMAPSVTPMAPPMAPMLAQAHTYVHGNVPRPAAVGRVPGCAQGLPSTGGRCVV
jgi:hypothetical protein